MNSPHSSTRASAPTKSLKNIRTLASHAEKALGISLLECVGEDNPTIRARLAAAEKRLALGVSDVRRKVADRTKRVDALVHRHPYDTAALAFGVGTLLGLLVHRRSRATGARR